MMKNEETEDAALIARADKDDEIITADEISDKVTVK